MVETVPRAAGQPWYALSGVKESVDPSWPKSASNWLRVSWKGGRRILIARIKLADINFRESSETCVCTGLAWNSINFTLITRRAQLISRTDELTYRYE